MLPSISIIIPVYNTEQYLSKCLDSCINQTYKNIEIVVVNDGSSDNSEEIVLEYQSKDARIKYVKHTQNKGLFLARATGVENATGEYILHVDSDDWIDLYLCEKLSKNISTNTDLILFNTLSIRTEGIEKGIWTNKGLQDSTGLGCFEALCERSLMSWTIWGKLLKKEIALKVYQYINFNGHLIMAEDLLFFSHYSYFSKNIIYLPINGYYYNLSNQSVNRTEYTLEKAKSHLSDLEIVMQKLEDFITQENLDKVIFDDIKLEILQGYLGQLQEPDIPMLSIELMPILSKYFGKQLLELAYQQSFMKQNIFRVRLDAIVKRIFVPNTWLYKTLRRFLLKIVRSK